MNTKGVEDGMGDEPKCLHGWYRPECPSCNPDAAVPAAQPAVPVEERTADGQPRSTERIKGRVDALRVAVNYQRNNEEPQSYEGGIWSNAVTGLITELKQLAEAEVKFAPIPEERTAEMEQLIPEYLLTDARTDYDSLVAAITALGWNPPGTSPESQNVPVECVVNIHQNGVIAKTVITTGRYEDEEDGPDFHPELGREWGGIDVVLWRPVTASDMEELAGRLREAAHELIVRQLHWKSEVHELPQAADACPGLDASKAKFAAEASPENILKLLDHIEGKAKAEEVQSVHCKWCAAPERLHGTSLHWCVVFEAEEVQE